MTPAGTSGDAASTEVGVVVNATDAVEIYGAVGTDNGSSSAVDNTIIGAKFTMGAATVGVQVNEASFT